MINETKLLFIVLNYNCLLIINSCYYEKFNSTNMDVFINSKLVASQPNIAPYMTYENVTIGSDNGIHGGICNIKYYNRPLTKNDIEITYKILKNKHRPLF